MDKDEIKWIIILIYGVLGVISFIIVLVLSLLLYIYLPNIK